MSSGELSLYQSEPALPYFTSDSRKEKALVFVPGLGDTIGAVPYLPGLAAALGKQGWALVQPVLSSSLGGYGVSSLAKDAREIDACIAHLRSKGVRRFAVMGHSTGCQDCIALLQQDVDLNAVILQAPVSDKEDYEYRRSKEPQAAKKQWDEQLEMARKLTEQGKGDQLMPRDGDAPPMSAYRHAALYAKGGDDDLFSSDLSDQQIIGPNSLGNAVKNLAAKKGKLLAILGKEDEFVPPYVDSASILRRWEDLINPLVPSGTFQTALLAGANHKIDAEEPQKELVSLIINLVKSLEE